MKKQKKKKIGKPNLLLAVLLRTVLGVVYRLKYGLVIEKSEALRELHSGQGLVIAPHTSAKDHWLVGMAVFPPVRPTFVVSEHFLAKPKLRPLLKLAHIVTKKMFCPDVGTVLNTLRAGKEGNTVILFPEGRLSLCGRTGRVTEGSGMLAKKLGLAVYVVTANGATLTFPKWAKAARRGRILVRTEKLLTKEEVAALTPAEIEARMQDAVTHDDFAVMQDVVYRSPRMAEGLDGILWRCPSCRREFTLHTEKNAIFCDCGMRAELDGHYRLSGTRFSSILSWYDWQCAEMDPAHECMECDADIGSVNEKGNMDPHAGHAHIRMDAENFTFAGEVFGKPVSFSRRTESIVAFPATVATEFDIYYNNMLLYMYPTPDRRAVAKWVAYLDRVVAAARDEEIRQTAAIGS